MYKLIASCKKELHILLRDKPGLAMLFLMPMALVLVITLIQNNILESSNQSKMKLLVINLDEGTLGRELVQGIEAGSFFEVIQKVDNQVLTQEKMQALVSSGEFQAGLLITKDASQVQSEKIAALLNEREFELESTTVSLLFDPNIQHAVRLTVLSVVKRLVQTQKIKMLLAQLQTSLDDILLMSMDDSGNIWTAAEHVMHGDSDEVGDRFALLHATHVQPNAVQHNVPGWTMFAIFFISLPLASGLIRERNESTLTRLRTMPVSIITIFMGKIITYTAISIIQLVLMLWIGKSILPLFGTPALDFGHSPGLILLVGICAGLAACGLGIFFGVMAKSYDQVASAGPIVIVIAAAIGGIMIPVFMMPEFIQPLSNISPLHWGHEAFIDIFLRGAGMKELWPNLLKLLLFFMAMITASMFIFRKQKY